MDIKSINKNLLLKIIFIALFVIIALSYVFSVKYAKHSLKSELMRDWEINNINNKRYYDMKLDFSDDTIDYEYVSKDADIVEKIDTYKYKVISSDEIKIEGKGTYKIEFNDDKNIMTVSPGIIDNSDFEFWYNNEGNK